MKEIYIPGGELKPHEELLLKSTNEYLPKDIYEKALNQKISLKQLLVLYKFLNRGQDVKVPDKKWILKEIETTDKKIEIIVPENFLEDIEILKENYYLYGFFKNLYAIEETLKKL